MSRRRPGAPRAGAAVSALLAALLTQAGGDSLRAQAAGGAQQADVPFTRAFLGPGVSEPLATWRAARVTAVRYALTLDLRSRDTARGTVVVRFRQPRAEDVVLDFRGLAVDGLEANGTALDAADTLRWNGHHLHVPASAARAGENAVTVRFRTPVAPAGAAIIRTRDATDPDDHLYTLLVPADANLLFPTFDQPDLKARLSLTLRIKPAWRALANGAAVARDSGPDGVITRFAETAPMSTYLMAFAAGPWAVITREHAIRPGEAAVPVSLWVRASRAAEVEADTLLAMNARALRWLGAWFGVPYPFGKYDLLLAPAFPFGGMEHPGAVFYNEQSFIFRERPTRSRLLGRQATTFHEVAHQWFGDHVTMRWFDDLWLKEGFATYMAAKMQDALMPDAGTWKTFHLRNKPSAYGTDATRGTTPVWQRLANLDQAKSNYGPIVYNKAPSVLKQLDFLVGEDAFQRGLRSFLAEHGGANATWRDLLRHVGDAAGRDLTPFGQDWILRPGMPVIEQMLRIEDGRIAQLALVQRPAQPEVSGPGGWTQRVRVRLRYPGGDDVVLPVETTGETTVVAGAAGLPAPAYVFANDGDFGNAIVLPDSASTQWLLANLASEPDDFRRALLWSALWDLVREAQLDPRRFAAGALAALPTETDEDVAAALIGRLGTAIGRYAGDAARATWRPRALDVLAAVARDTSRPYGTRRTALGAWVGLAESPAELAAMAAWLDGEEAFGLPMTPPLRWSVVTRLVSRNAAGAADRLQAEAARDTSSDGRRRAFVAGAAWPDAETKRRTFARWFADSSLNEQWVTSSLGAFFDADHAALTLPYLEPALDTLPWIQRNRRIFFLGRWLGALLGGQDGPEALAAVDAWLAAHPALAPDLRRKVLEARDGLARRVRIRAAYGEAPR
jgi:aminopeptidase N